MMARKKFKYIYGPVASWRLGSSLGIDLLAQRKKVCTFDCLYCQLGKAPPASTKRKLYVPTKDILAELKSLPKVPIDYITFSGRGEPTLAINLGRTLKAVRKLRPEPIAVLTNASLLYRKDVRKELALADLVAVKLDAHCAGLFQLINRPAKKVNFAQILKGIKQFSRQYKGKLALQIMFVKYNRNIAQNIVKLVKDIRPAQVQICTPTRAAQVRPVARSDILQIKRYFQGMRAVSVYDRRRRSIRALDLQATNFRRGRDRCAHL